MATRHLIISGKVQGVFFRASAKKQAFLLDLKGWVKNTDTGSVECLVSGNEEAIEQFITWCHQGPEAARVSSVQVNSHAETSFTGFNITH